MTNYYNSLCIGRDTAHKKAKFGVSGGSPNTTKTSRWWLASLFMVMSFFAGQDVLAQVSYSNNFNANATGWTGTITRTTATTACGSASMRRNMYSGATTGTMISPLTGTSLGGAMTLTYDYKVANWSANTVGTSGWGSFNVQYGATATGPWTTVQTVDTSNHIVSGTCASKSVTFTPPAGALYIKWDAVWAAGDYYINFDNVAINEAVATPPNCATGLTPADLTSDIARNPTLTWTAATGVPTSYDIYFGDTPSAPFVTNVSSATLSYSPGVLNASSTYYWKVVAKNANGDAVGCAEQSFMTGTNFNYCSSGLTTSGGASDSVIGVTVGTYVSGAIGGVSPWYTAVANTPIDIVAPSSQSISITMGTDGTQHSAVWIDFNQDGTFDASENVALSTVAAGANAVVSYTLAIPSTATLGVTRMRVRGAGDGAYTAAGACTGQAWGETEDYLVNLIAPPPSPPDCATALLPSDLSSDLPRNLTLTWTAAAGFPTSYDVYLSTASGSITPVANVTGTSYTTAILDASTQYFWSVIAKNDNGEAVGCAEQSFTTGTSFNYCDAVPSSIDGNGITNVVLETLSNPNVSTTTYQNFTTGLPVPDLGTSLTIPMSVSYTNGVTYETRVFIDFNQDGDFSDASENQLLGTSTTDNPTTLSGTISIPSGALAGNTRMRVIGSDFGVTTACYNGTWANVEDYTVNITITPPCSGAPAVAVASSSVTGACVGVPFTLSVTGQTNGLGITYQWESADDVDFTTGVTALGTALSQPIASQTSTKYYRFATTCSTGPDTTYSNVVEVTQNGPTQCYCTPVTTSGCTDGDVIGRVVLNTLDNTSGVGCPSGTLGYSDYTSNPLLTTELQAGTTYACTVTAGEWAGSYAAWIDYNDDGVFDPVTERIGYTTTPVAGSGNGSGILGASASFPITLSCSPPVGVHRLRVREMFNIAGSAMTPCGNNGFGEVEDYLITITAAVACPQPSALAAASVTSSGASLSWTAGCLETEWDVNIQAAGSGEPTSANNAGLTTTTLVASGLDAATVYEYYVRAVCTTGSEYSLWTGPFTFTTLANAPGCTVVDSPADGATGVTVGTIPFSWTAPAVSPTEGAATSYDLYYGTSATPGVANTLVGNFTTTSTNIILTGYNATFYLRVVPKNSGGSAVGPCTVTSFTTESDPFVPYCSSVTYTSDIEPISSVSFAGINNTSSNVVDGSPSIENFTAVSGNVTANSSYTMTIKGHTGGNFTTNLMVFADWNQDGDFADAGETYNAGSLTNSNGIDAVSAVSTIAVPVNALPGTTRMRIKKMFGTADNNPCVGAGFGQTEDYTLNVTGFTTNVATASCGSTLANIYSSVYANIKSGATGYRFRVVGGTAGTQTIDRGIYHWFNLTQLPSYDYGTTYTVDVMLQVDGVWADYYGQSCTITTPGLISPTLGSAVVSSPTCGSVLANIYTSIYTTPKSGATGYRFRVVRAGGETQVLDRTQHFFNLTQLPIFVYGASYTVEVAFKATGDYTPYGTACTLSSPAVPSIAECGLSRTAGSTISVPALSSVTNYAFEVTDLTNSTTPVVINRSVQWMPVTLIPGYLATNEYSVRVALTSSGVQSDYGLDCSINPAAAVRYSNSSYASELKVQAFPNPFTNNFTLDITRASDENVSVMVYDMIGKLLDKVTVNATDNTLELGANYPAGVYNVIVSQGEKVETVRMVKR